MLHIRHRVVLRSLFWAAVLSRTFATAYAQTPTIASISPNGSPLCGSLVTLTVTGSNFVPGSYVQFNGVGNPLATTFVDANHLTTYPLENAECVTGGTLSVTVVNPNGAVSPPVDFVVQGPGATTYRYTGSTFVFWWGGFACPPECRITGSFTVAEPLAPNLVNDRVVPASWNFSDGYFTSSGSNSLFTDLPQPTGGDNANNILVWTDSSGAITSWTIALGGHPGDYMVSSQQGDVIGTGCANCAGAAGASSLHSYIDPTTGVLKIVSSPPGTWTSFPASLPLQITTTSIPPACGTTYGTTLTATGGTGSLTWSYSGSLPPGFSLSPDGVLSSTGSTVAPAGSYPFTVELRDSAGNIASPQPLTVVIPININLLPYADGQPSRDRHPTSMNASFTPTNASRSVMTLIDAAQACGFSKFDWVQIIDQSPGGVYSYDTCLAAHGTFDPNTGNCTVSIPPLKPPPPYLDPPAGGYTYFQAPGYLAKQPNEANAFPFYLSPLDIGPGGNTLNFSDTPHSSGCNPPADCFAFTTQLVGVCEASSLSPLCNPSGRSTPPFPPAPLTPPFPSAPLLQWTWKSNYNGTDTKLGFGGVYDVTVTAGFYPAEPDSGTGGVTITSINGVAQTPPTVTCTARPNTLWPPNGESVSVTVSGSVAVGTQPIPSDGTIYAVSDEYGQHQPNGNFTFGSGGTYSFKVPLIAARNGDDLDGRTYTINIIAGDQIGNTGTCSAVITVPHDQSR